jgi:hypothetical protein
MTERCIVLALFLSLCGALWPAPASAQVDTWRVLHVGLQSGASVDTDGDGVVNSWYKCQQRGNSKKAHCRFSDLYDKWQADIACFRDTVEAWTDYQIAIEQDVVFIETSDAVHNNPYEMERYEAQYGFESYDVIMVWTAYTQALGFDGGTWNGVTGGYSSIGLYGLAGGGTGVWPDGVPAHEFVHAVTGLYMAQGFPVCGTYEYPYGEYGEWEGHHRILTNTFRPITCSNGVVSTGVPPEAWASGSYTDYYG